MLRIPSRFSYLLLVLPAAGCAGTLFHGQALTTTSAPADAYTCIREQVRALTYQERAHDDTDYRVVAEKIDDTVHRPDTQFRRLIDRLVFTIAPNAQGTTSVTVEAHTFAEITSQRGPTLIEEEARPRVRVDAASIAAHCAP